MEVSEAITTKKGLTQEEIKKIIDESDSIYDTKSFNINNEDKELRSLAPGSEYRGFIVYTLFYMNIEKMIKAYFHNTAKYYYVLGAYYWNGEPVEISVSKYRIKKVLTILGFDEAIEELRRAGATEIDTDTWENFRYRIWYMPVFGKYDRILEHYYLCKFFTYNDKKDKDDIIYMSIIANMYREWTSCYSMSIGRYVPCNFKDDLRKIDKDVSEILGMKIFGV